MIIACTVCGGLELLIIGSILSLFPFLGTFWHKIKNKCCKKNCNCDCHDKKENL